MAALMTAAKAICEHYRAHIYVNDPTNRFGQLYLAMQAVKGDLDRRDAPTQGLTAEQFRKALDTFMDDMMGRHVDAVTNEQKAKDMLEAAKPLIKWLNDNCHPHCSIVVTPDSVELYESQARQTTTEFILD